MKTRYPNARKAGVVLAVLLLAGCVHVSSDERRAPPAPEFLGYTGEPRIETERPEPVQILMQWRQVVNRVSVDGGSVRSGPAIGRSRYRWCATGHASPAALDLCYDFDPGSLSCLLETPAAVLRQRDCSATATISASLANTSGVFYIRAEHPDDSRLYTASNTREYAWTVRPD